MYVLIEYSSMYELFHSAEFENIKLKTEILHHASEDISTTLHELHTQNAISKMALTSYLIL